MIGNVPGVDRLLVHGWLRGLRDVGGGGAEQRHNETRECVVVSMTPVWAVMCCPQQSSSRIVPGGFEGAPI